MTIVNPRHLSPLDFICLIFTARLALLIMSSTNLSATEVTDSSSSSSADDDGDSLAGIVGKLSSELDDSWGGGIIKLPGKDC